MLLNNKIEMFLIIPSSILYYFPIKYLRMFKMLDLLVAL